MPLKDIYSAGHGCNNLIITTVSCLKYMPQRSLHFLKNLPNKLECYITLSRKGFPGTNTLVYWAHSQVTKKKKCEYCCFKNLPTIFVTSSGNPSITRDNWVDLPMLPMFRKTIPLLPCLPEMVIHSFTTRILQLRLMYFRFNSILRLCYISKVVKNNNESTQQYLYLP